MYSGYSDSSKRVCTLVRKVNDEEFMENAFDVSDVDKSGNIDCPAK
jgi:Ca2+-binding EF-hand superfamily protein